MVKDSLNNLVSERAVADSKSTLGLLCAVTLKYGTGPIVLGYCMYVMLTKDEVIQRNNETVVSIVREQTTATAQNTIALQGLNTMIQNYNQKLSQIEDDRKEERRGFRTN